jgi:4-amino-4-deoxy-L-arabinose transferase-like glycosyltransferase
MYSFIQRFSFPVGLTILASLFLRVLFLANHDLLPEEAYYWNYSIHLDFGYLDHPPLVAVLIKLSTFLFGLNEFSVRFPALLCWGIATYFIYRWSELIQKGSGQFSILLLSILPFFFIDSCVITPDMPLFAAWAAGLYFLYRALYLDEAPAWYGVGFGIGLGMLAKYSMLLLVLATGVFLLTQCEHRKWLLRKEPYYAAIIALILFSPVIYWNMLHHWVSILFQSTRRLHTDFCFSLHELLGLLILFLTPIGMIGLGRLLRPYVSVNLSLNLKRFIQIQTFIPLLVFGIYSCFHATKFNWIGPGLLAIIPWLACLMQDQRTYLKHWLRALPFFIGVYALLTICISYGRPVFLNKLFFTKMVSWQHLTEDFYQIAESQQAQTIFVPLDLYNIASELTFYQTKQWKQTPDRQPFAIAKAGLMFALWDNVKDLHGKTIIFISSKKSDFHHGFINSTERMSPINTVWGVSQDKAYQTIPYYYQIARLP